MSEEYKKEIAGLIARAPFEIDPDIRWVGRTPTMASSEFLTNKEQGDWAEEIVFRAINEYSSDFRAIRYGRSESPAAGDPGFSEFYRAYGDELNAIGKKPDLLVFHKADLPGEDISPDDDSYVSRAVAAIEVRSSSFLSGKYSAFMESRSREATDRCRELRERILTEPHRSVLLEKNRTIHDLVEGATEGAFRDLDFRLPSWSSSEPLREISALLRSLKEQIQILHRRDYLGITPKVEDLALVNRWIQRYGVRHYYLQVFFDRAYVIPFREVLAISSDPSKEDVVFSVERDVKNQGKTTIKIDVKVGRELLGRIDMPEHASAMKELERGRLLFYVTFKGGRGYLDHEVFLSDVVHGR